MKCESIGKNSIWNIFAISARYAPFYFGLCLGLTIIDGLMTPVMIIVVAQFIDAAVTVASEAPKFKEIILYALLIGANYLYVQFSQECKIYYYELMQDVFKRELKSDAIKRQFSIDYAVLETEEVQNLLLRVTDQIEQKFVGVVQTCNHSISMLIQIVGVLMTVARFQIAFVAIYACIMFLLFMLTFKNGRQVYQHEKKIGDLTRRLKYLSEILSNREASGERVLFGFSRSINSDFKQAHLARSNFNTKILAKETWGTTLVNVIMNIATVLIVFSISRQVMAHKLSMGLFTSIVGSLISLSKMVSIQSSELILQFSSHYEYAKDFQAFLELRTDMESLGKNGTKMEPVFLGLEIHNLTFKYPGAKDFVFKGLNLRIEKGKSYSLVGVNGAGKTTLIKILLGLYRDYNGKILLNDRDLQEYDVSELRRIFSVVSQDYAKYYITLKENITLGNANADIHAVLDIAGLEDLIESLPAKEDSYLGKIYEDGIDLSGGEWQKIAIARALYRNSPFLIMDEPTASLSPTAESAIYHQLLEIAKDKTLFMISHRLGSTKIADEIIVLDQGTIIEQGSHATLIMKNGLYANLFRKQSEMYGLENQ